MDADKEMLEAMVLDFSALSEENKKKIIETTELLVHTQEMVVPEILAKKTKDKRVHGLTQREKESKRKGIRDKR